MSEPTPDRPDDAPSEAPNDVPHDAPDPADLPPAYFLSLTLENVRCFGPEQTLDLSDGDGNWAQWTVILGDNGTGKTTLLQAISSTRTVYSYEQDKLEGWSRILLQRPFFDAYREPKPSINLRQKTEEAEVRVREVFPRGAVIEHSGKAISTRESSINMSRSTISYEAESIDPPAYAFVVGFGANRRMEKAGFEETDSYGTEGLLNDEFFLPNAHDWLRQTDYAAKSGKELAKKRLNQILEVLAVILPDVHEVELRDQEGYTALPKVEFHTPYGWVTMDQLSLGYRTMIAWIVDLARRLFERYPDMENPLEGAAVCLVDEIDLHLHPRWQRKIIGFLSERFPNTQFIVTAHSPLIVQAAQDANIAVLKRSDEPDETGAHYVEIHNDLEPLRNLRVDQILTSDLYGLDSARPPQIEHLVQEKIEILSKSTLSDEDRARLEELENEIGHLPAGETKEERETLDFMRRVAERLESEGEAVQANDA